MTTRKTGYRTHSTALLGPQAAIPESSVANFPPRWIANPSKYASVVWR